MESYSRLRNVIVSGAILVAVLLAPTPVDSAEFRGRRSIPTPKADPIGAIPVETIRPVDPAAVERGVRRLFDAYRPNTGELEKMLGEELVDRSRLLGTLSERLPRDAKLKLLSLQSVQTLNQYIEPDPTGGGNLLVSTVAATVRSELEFNDPVAGFQRLEGTTELLLRIKRTAP